MDKSSDPTRLREFLTIISLALSIGGVLYSLWLRPSANISILNGKVAVIEYRLNLISDDIQWIKNRLR